MNDTEKENRLEDSIGRPEFKKKAIRSYVIRAGRITEGQRLAFETWSPKYRLSMFAGAIDYTEVFQREAENVLELGFGMGDSLFEMAQNETEKNFIGIEVHPPGVGRLINCAGLAGVDNLRVYMADAVDVLDDCIPDASLDRFQLYFPDPWHKVKHWKRRIVQDAFAQKIRQKLKVGGVFHMATDWEDYAKHMMKVMTGAEGYENVAGELQYSEKPDYRPNTKFEKRGERLGHGVWDLLFKRIN